ncbi:hypothetical protein BD779DRAFT_1471091 [Infundibulicybe gibba]|nr:hypothetical protein BD779DRAFT_1471091 [Infundibulicybe gibba]
MAGTPSQSLECYTTGGTHVLPWACGETQIEYQVSSGSIKILPLPLGEKQKPLNRYSKADIYSQSSYYVRISQHTQQLCAVYAEEASRTRTHGGDRLGTIRAEVSMRAELIIHPGGTDLRTDNASDGTICSLPIGDLALLVVTGFLGFLKVHETVLRRYARPNPEDDGQQLNFQDQRSRFKFMVMKWRYYIKVPTGSFPSQSVGIERPTSLPHNMSTMAVRSCGGRFKLFLLHQPS